MEPLRRMIWCLEEALVAGVASFAARGEAWEIGVGVEACVVVCIA